MKDAKVAKTRARVQVTVEIDVPDAWGGDCTVAQVFVQAKDSAIGILRWHFIVDGFTNAGPTDMASRPKVSIVGEPIVLAIHTEGTAR